MLKWIAAVTIIIVGGLTLLFLACVLTVVTFMARWADHQERLNLWHEIEKHAQGNERAG